MRQALIFDLGGTHLRSGVLDEGGSVRHVVKRRLPSAPTGATAADSWACVLSAVAEYASSHDAALPPTAPIVLAVPGPVSAHRTIVQAPTLAGADARIPDVAATIERAAGRPVILLNDVSAAAWQISERTPVTRFLVVTVSSGIGSKIFDRDHPARVLDQPEYSGEIGHVVVDDGADAPLCDCGGRGHLGAVASGRGIERAATRRAVSDPAGFAASWMGRRAVRPDALRNEEHLVPAARAGDGWALGVVRECTRPLSRSLLGVFMAAGLERIYLIGGFAQALGEPYLEIVRSQVTELSRYAVSARALSSAIEIAAPDEETCLHGCAAFVRGSPRFAAEARDARAALRGVA